MVEEKAQSRGSGNGRIRYRNRSTGRIECEQVYGDVFLRWAYGNPVGRAAVWLVIKRIWFSRFYGWLMDRPGSRRRIDPFIRNFGINTEEMADPPEAFPTFNAFFCRKLRAGARPTAGGEDVAVFPADGRHRVIADLGAAETFFAKGQRFDLRSFLADGRLAEEFGRGAMLISRLCPVDYHRFHFPVSGRAGAPRWPAGCLASVNPLALRRKLSILWENRRAITRLETERFGPVLLVEIGATCVGRIRQTFPADSEVGKGTEKGYFAFGGSCVVTLFRRGAVVFDEDLLREQESGLEVYARMGERFGVAAHSANPA